MGRPQASFTKRQREQAKKDKKVAKADKRAQRKTEGGSEDDMIARPVQYDENGFPIEEDE